MSNLNLDLRDTDTWKCHREFPGHKMLHRTADRCSVRECHEYSGRTAIRAGRTSDSTVSFVKYLSTVEKRGNLINVK